MAKDCFRNRFTCCKEEDGRDSSGGSPFSAPVLRRLFSFYCKVGIVPGCLSKDHCCFVVKWWKHGIAATLAVVYYTVKILFERLLAGQYEKSQTDKAVSNLATAFQIIFTILFVWANHMGFSQCYRINTRLFQSSGIQYPSPYPILKHHFILVFLIILEVVSQNIGILTYKDNLQKVNLTIVLLQIMIKLFISWYFFTLWLVAELAIDRLFQCLGAILSHALDELNGKRSDVKEFCDRADMVRNCYGSMGKNFGNGLLVLILSSLVQMIWRSYFLVSHFFGADGIGLVSWQSLQHVIMIFISMKRLSHVTGIVHEFRKRVDDVLEKLVDLEASASSPTERASALRMYRLLGDSAKDGLSVRGFFVVDRIVFPELIGFFLTYLVLLIEFRAGEEGDDGGGGGKKNDMSSAALGMPQAALSNGTGLTN